MRGGWRELAADIAGRTGIVARFLCLCHVTTTYLCSPTLVYGPSMLPTLNLTGDVVLTDRLSTRFKPVRVGDLVVVRSPDNPTRMVTKRVVGVAGDTVTFSVHPNRSPSTLIVPHGHVWIQGDNMYASKDSRHYGPVPCGLIQGKVFLRVGVATGRLWVFGIIIATKIIDDVYSLMRKIMVSTTPLIYSLEHVALFGQVKKLGIMGPFGIKFFRQ